MPCEKLGRVKFWANFQGAPQIVYIIQLLALSH